jgi:hypothetical protein
MVSSLSFLDTEQSIWKSARTAHKTYAAALTISALLLLIGCTVMPFTLLLATKGATVAHFVWALAGSVAFVCIVEIVKQLLLQKPRGTLS